MYFSSHSEGEGDLNKWSLSWSQNDTRTFGHYMQIGGVKRWLIQYQQDILLENGRIFPMFEVAIFCLCISMARSIS